MNDPKFPDCRECKFYHRRHQNPICRQCGVGEFFEERIRERALPDRAELLSLSSRIRDDDDE